MPDFDYHAIVEMEADHDQINALGRALDAVTAKHDALAAEVERLRHEVDRLQRWLQRISGGDYPCQDEAQLRRWAYEAVTLGREAPDA